MTTRNFVCGLLACLSLAACGPEGGSCGDAPHLQPAAGSTVIADGDLIPGATAQRMTVSTDRRFLDYTFTRNGVTMTARYALEAPASSDPAP